MSKTEEALKAINKLLVDPLGMGFHKHEIYLLFRVIELDVTPVMITGGSEVLFDAKGGVVKDTTKRTVNYTKASSLTPVGERQG